MLWALNVVIDLRHWTDAESTVSTQRGKRLVIVVAIRFLPLRGHCGWGVCPACVLRAKESWQTETGGKQASWGWTAGLFPSFFFWFLCFLPWTWPSVWLGPFRFFSLISWICPVKVPVWLVCRKKHLSDFEDLFFQLQKLWLLIDVHSAPPPQQMAPQNGRLGIPLLLFSSCIPSRAPHPQ